MTPEQITLVQTSYQRAGLRLPELAERFYIELFQRDPALRPLFPPDRAERGVRSGGKPPGLADAMPRLDGLLPHPRALGARHVGYGVRAADYETVGAALIAAIATVL